MHSRKKVVHLPGCAYVRRMHNANRKQFDTLSLALDSGYRPCRCCCPSVQRKFAREKRKIEAFSQRNGLFVFSAEDGIHVISKLDTWRIVRTYGKACFDLYHRNTQVRAGDTKSAVPGFHMQKVYRDSILGYLQFIRAHDDYRQAHPLPAAKPAPAAKSVPAAKPLQSDPKDECFQKIIDDLFHFHAKRLLPRKRTLSRKVNVKLLIKKQLRRMSELPFFSDVVVDRHGRFRHGVHVFFDDTAVIRVLLVLLERVRVVEHDLQDHVVGTRRMQKIDADLNPAQQRHVAVHGAQHLRGLLTGLFAVVFQFEANDVFDHNAFPLLL